MVLVVLMRSHQPTGGRGMDSWRQWKPGLCCCVAVQVALDAPADAHCPWMRQARSRSVSFSSIRIIRTAFKMQAHLHTLSPLSLLHFASLIDLVVLSSHCAPRCRPIANPHHQTLQPQWITPAWSRLNRRHCRPVPADQPSVS